MQPSDLTSASFTHYPEQGHTLAHRFITLLQRLPLVLLPTFLQQLKSYDYRFPKEQADLSASLTALNRLAPPEFEKVVAPFRALVLPDELQQLDWVDAPARFNEALSAVLWSSHQKDAHRAAAIAFQQWLKSTRPASVAEDRWVTILMGKDAPPPKRPLFRPLRPMGTLFTNIDPSGGHDTLFRLLQQRAQSHPEPYAHWYIDGGEPLAVGSSIQGLALTSYRELAPAIVQQFSLLHNFTQQHAGTAITAEDVRSFISALSPEALGLDKIIADPILRHFNLNILTESAGTQIFSTTFLQWSARELLLKAKPSTLFARFASRQIMAPINELLSRNPIHQPVDTAGSIIDEEQAAYYTWINLQRIATVSTSRFLVWHEASTTALAISPSLAQGTVAENRCTLEQIIHWMA